MCETETLLTLAAPNGSLKKDPMTRINPIIYHSFHYEYNKMNGLKEILQLSHFLTYAIKII